jgi:hypothetical protein
VRGTWQLKGGGQELQQTLALIETLTEKAQKAADAASGKGSNDAKTRKARTKFDPTEQPKLPIGEQIFELDAADRTCRAAAGSLPRWSISSRRPR